MKPGVIAALAATTLLAACATAPGSVRPTMVSDDTYRNAPCDRLTSERSRIDGAYADAAHAQTRTRQVDFVGLLLVGLPISTLTGHSHTKEIGLLKGQREAVERAYAAGGCARAQ